MSVDTARAESPAALEPHLDARLAERVLAARDGVDAELASAPSTPAMRSTAW